MLFRSLLTGTLSMQRDTLSDLKKGALSEIDLAKLQGKSISTKEMFDMRARGLGKQGKDVPGLLGIYLIDKDSVPKGWDANKTPTPLAKKRPLNAPADVLGITMFFPGAREMKLAVEYTSLDASKLGIFDDDEEDLDQLIDEAEEADNE